MDVRILSALVGTGHKCIGRGGASDYRLVEFPLLQAIDISLCCKNNLKEVWILYWRDDYGVHVEVIDKGPPGYSYSFHLSYGGKDAIYRLAGTVAKVALRVNIS